MTSEEAVWLTSCSRRATVGLRLSRIDGGRANTDRLRLQRHGLVPRPTAVSGSDWCVLSGMMGVVDGGPAFESYFLLAHFGDCDSCS